jgi:hypothetical protein
VGEDLHRVYARLQIDAHRRSPLDVDAINRDIRRVGKRIDFKVARSARVIVVIAGVGHSRECNRNDQH